eukprot:gene21988-26486_t
MPHEHHILNWHIANLEYANAACMHELSLAHWDQDDPNELQGHHCFLPGGNLRLVTALAEGVPVFYSTAALQIAHGQNGVEVTCTNGKVFRADVALCTMPLGVLKSGSIQFEPELPGRKQHAIRSLGPMPQEGCCGSEQGVTRTVAMLFPHAFWGDGIDTFGRVADSTGRRGEYFLFY